MIKVIGRYTTDVYTLGGIYLGRRVATNFVTLESLNDIPFVYLAGGTQKTSWYMSLIDSTSFSELSTSDTASSHAGWLESTAYSESTRPVWTPGTVAGQTITNPSPTIITLNADAIIKGLFLISNSTKGGTSGTLFSEALYDSGDGEFPSGKVLKNTYTLTFSNG